MCYKEQKESVSRNIADAKRQVPNYNAKTKAVMKLTRKKSALSKFLLEETADQEIRASYTAVTTKEAA